MAVNRMRYYIGPLGYLQAFPAMLGGANYPEVGMRLPSAQHTSLSGRTTQDRMGVPKRVWSLVWENLTEADRLAIDALIYGSSGKPSRIVDPRRLNQLPPDASTGGSLSFSAGAFSSSTLVTDACGAVVSNGWGTADTGQAWTTIGGAAGDFSKAGGRALHAANTVNVSRRTVLDAPMADPDWTFSVATDKLATGASQSFGAIIRFLDTSNYIEARVEFTTAQTLFLTVQKVVAGAATVLFTGTLTGLTHAANTRFSCRIQAVGSLIRSKVWLTSGTQPDAWASSVVDSSLLGAGKVGVRSALFSGNTNSLPVNYAFDDFQLTGSLPLSYLNATVPTGLQGILAGAQSWSGLFLNSILSVATEQMPILAGSTYRFSVYALGTAQVKLMARPFDVSGVEQTLQTGSTETLTGAYQRFSWLWTPSAGHVAAYFGLQAQGTGTVQTTGWHVGIDRPSLDPWSMGVGCPTVVVDPDIPSSYWRDRLQRVRLTVRES